MFTCIILFKKIIFEQFRDPATKKVRVLLISNEIIMNLLNQLGKKNCEIIMYLLDQSQKISHFKK